MNEKIKEEIALISETLEEIEDEAADAGLQVKAGKFTRAIDLMKKVKERATDAIRLAERVRDESGEKDGDKSGD